MEKLILIVNDDGWNAQGLKVLSRTASAMGQVIVVAPCNGRSGAACSITPATPVIVERIPSEQSCKAGYAANITVYSCTGTPVDCVKIAREKILSRNPDLVLSGINHGDNASVSLFYSGTVGAIVEACLKGYPAIAFSLRTRNKQCDFAPYEQVARHWIDKILKEGLPIGSCLNINFPEVKALKGTSFCRMAKGIWHTEWIEIRNDETTQKNTQNETHTHTLSGIFENLEPDAEDTDYWALDHDMASVTPLKLDMTDYALLSDRR